MKSLFSLWILLIGSTMHAQEMPVGYWQVINLPLVYQIEADGTFKQLGSERLGQPVMGTFVFTDDTSFEVKMRHHMIVEKGYVADGKLFLVNKDQNIDIWLPELELKRISEEDALNLATTFSALSGQPSERFKELRAERSQKYLEMIREDAMEGLVANAYYVLAEREQAIAQEEALSDLEHKSPYVRLAAALYLAKYGQQEAIPVLIAALNEKKIRSKDDVIRALVELTEVDQGADYDAWHDWWLNRVN
jgi:hypothetical protein